MTWVYLSSTEPDSLPALDTIWEAGDCGSLAVQGAGEEVCTGATASAATKGQAVGDGLLNLL